MISTSYMFGLDASKYLFANARGQIDEVGRPKNVRSRDDDMNKQIRWQQRFQHLENAFLFLEEGLKKPAIDPLQEAGIIQTFEFTFKLAWKTLKDFLESKGTVRVFPKDILKEAFHTEIIQDGHLWMEMLDKRNFLSHTYNRKQASEAVRLIRNSYFGGLKQVYLTLKQQCLD